MNLIAGNREEAYDEYMPAKNVTKVYVEDSYYHVYNRGASKQKVFRDDEDYEVFLSLFKRYLDPKGAKMPNRQPYPCYAKEVSLMAYCLMPNHYHLLVYQSSKDGMKKLLTSIGTAYSMYFNRKYHHVGTVFQQRYRAVRMTDDAQFAHISRYIHLNPEDYIRWPWSSLGYYLGDKHAAWLNTELLPDVSNYRKFLDDYVDRRDELKLLSKQLAG